MPAFLAALAPMLPGLASVLGGAASGAGKDRADMNEVIAANNRTQGGIYDTQQGAAVNLMQLLNSGLLDRAKLGLEAPTQRMNQLIRGSLLANVKPAALSGFSSRVKVPTISGGLTPAALSNAARAGGGEMQRQALLKLFSGADVPKMPNFGGAMITPPKLQQPKGAGLLESILSGAALGTGLLGPVVKGWPKGKPAPGPGTGEDI